MGTGWLTCNLEVLLPHSPCRSTTANAPANRQMPIASVVSGQCKKMKNKHLLTFKAKEKTEVYEKTRKKKMKQIKYLLIIISIVLVGCNWTKHKEPKIRYTGYTLYQGMCDIHSVIKIDSVTSLE